MDKIWNKSDMYRFGKRFSSALTVQWHGAGERFEKHFALTSAGRPAESDDMIVNMIISSVFDLRKVKLAEIHDNKICVWIDSRVRVIHYTAHNTSTP